MLNTAKNDDKEDNMGKLEGKIAPLGRLGHPDEIAKAAVFLAFGDSSHITGAELFVDDGFAHV